MTPIRESSDKYEVIGETSIMNNSTKEIHQPVKQKSANEPYCLKERGMGLNADSSLPWF
jgi:hypothetical protein